MTCMWKQENMSHFKGIGYEVIISTIGKMTKKLKSPGLVGYFR